MILSTRQVSLLNEMGIPVWQRRALKTAQDEPVENALTSVSSDNSALLQQIEQVNWVMVLDQLSADTQQLLARICRAMSIPEQQYCVVSLSDIKSLSDLEASPNKVCVLFCDSEDTPWHKQATPHRLLPTQQRGLASLVSHDLRHALNKPVLKAQIWRDVLQAQQYIQQQQ